VPTAPPVTYREAVHGLCRAAGVAPVRVTQLPHLALRAAGMLSPMLRELEETRYQFTRPYVLDSTAATATFGIEATPLDRTFADTVAWWRSRTPRRAAVTRG
jgi:nucleoside-diphosphate-sugar epimerase